MDERENEKRKGDDIYACVDRKRGSAGGGEENSEDFFHHDNVDVIKAKVGGLIGSKGVIIQEIMRRSGCRITIDQDFPEGQPHKVQISSRTLENISIAKDLIARIIELGPTALNSQLDHDDSPMISTTMDCPQDKVGIVIGARGVVINDIMRRTGCKVVIDQSKFHITLTHQQN